MTLRSIVTPALACFILVLCIAIFASISQKSLRGSENLQTDSLTGMAAATPENQPLIQDAKTSTSPSTTPPVSRVVPKPKPTSKPTVSNRCIVTVQGKRYDVTSLRKTHSGGNIFTCGKDMTTTFTSQHGTNFNMLKPYLIG